MTKWHWNKLAHRSSEWSGVQYDGNRLESCIIALAMLIILLFWPAILAAILWMDTAGLFDSEAINTPPR